MARLPAWDKTKGEALGAYRSGTTLDGLTAMQEAELTFGERLEGVWPFLIWTCGRYEARLRPAGVAIALEDLIQELVLALVDRDGKWDPTRGKYTTFVNAVFRNVRSAERERSGVVKAPRNAWCRLKKYRADHEQGRSKPCRQRTMRALEAVMDLQGALPPEVVAPPGPVVPEFGLDLEPEETP